MVKVNTIPCYSMVLAILFSNLALFSHNFVGSRPLEQKTTTSPHMQSEIVNETHDKSSCPKGAQIQVSQGPEAMTGIPRYSVTITNLCTNCSVAEVHLHCGMFASANVVNPNLFKRIAVDDCLVNGGKPIGSGKVIEFEYSNTRPYPLSVASYVCQYN